MSVQGAPRRSAGRPRDPRLDATIVAATVELLTERGYNDTSLASVAERAGTTTLAIYRRWSSKAELVMHAVFRTDGDDVVAETDDLEADITTMVRWSVEKVCRPAALAAFGGILGEAQPERAGLGAAAAWASQQVVARLERAQGEGRLRSDLEASVIAATITGPVIHAAFSGAADQVDERWIQSLVSIVMDGSRPRAMGVLEHETDTGARTERRPTRRHRTSSARTA